MPGVSVIQDKKKPTQALHHQKEKIEALGTMFFYWMTQVSERLTIVVETYDATLSKIVL